MHNLPQVLGVSVRMSRESSLILHGRGNILGVLRSALWSFAEEGMVPALRSE